MPEQAFPDGPQAFGNGSKAYGPSDPPQMNMPSASTFQTPVASNLGMMAPDYEANREAYLDQVAQRESGNRNVVNTLDPRRSSASGYWQTTDTTWRGGAALAGVDTRQYPRATAAPYATQRQVARALYDQYGQKPWAQTVRSAPVAVASRALEDY